MRQLALRWMPVMLVFLGCGFAVAGAKGNPAPAAAPEWSEFDASQSELRPMIEHYAADRATLMRSYALLAPPIRVDGTASATAPQEERARGGGEAVWAMSPAYRARLKDFHTAWIAALEKLDFASLSQEGKIDYLLFRRFLGHELSVLDRQAKQAAAIEPLVPFANSVLSLADEQRRREFVDASQAAVTLDQIAKQVEQARKAVESAVPAPKEKAGDTGRAESVAATPKPRAADVTRAVGAINALRNTLASWFGLYYGYDPEFTWWVTEPYRRLDKALASYATLISERLAPDGRAGARAIVGNPIGREALMAELAKEMIAYTPEELIAIAEREFAWCEKEMKRASRELGYGDDWLKALEYVKTKHVKPGEQARLIRDMAYEAVEFLDKNDLVTVPPLALEDWRIQMMSPERQLVNPFFTGGDMISVSFPTSTMTNDEKLMSMRGNNIAFAHATVFHELIPGHHLQGYMGRRYRAYRSLFSTPFAVEGWPLYWELLMWDLGFQKTPEERMGALFWRMHRCSRIIFSLNFHLGRMTVQDCIDLLVNRAGHERANAEAEVRRSFDGSYGPLYQAAYLVGGLQLRELREELVGSGKMTNRAFHDAVLKQGPIPIEMIRASLTKQKLTREYTTNWRFYVADK